MINNFLVGGVERLILDIISSLDKDKYDIKVVTILGSGTLEVKFRELEIPIYFAGIASFFPKKLPFKLFWLLIAPIILLRITFFLLKSKPDVVVSSLYQADVLGMIAAKIVGVKKRILIQHDIVQFNNLIRFVKKKFALKFSTQIVSISETVKNFLIKYFEVKSEKIITIYNGIDYKYFKKGMKLIPDLDAPVIGVIGRLEEIKGQIYVLKAMKILKDKNNLSPTVLLAGDGALRGNLEKYVIENNLNNIKFLGSVDDVPDFLSKVDVIVIPSLSEGFGLVVLEGLVSGKAIIASDIEVMQELIKEKENGLLFESQNSNSLAEVLFEVLNNKKLREELQKGVISFSEQNKSIFDIYEVSKNYQNLFIS